MAFTEPKTRAEWEALRGQLAKATADDYAGVDPAKFASFRAGILALTDGTAMLKTSAIGCAPILALMLAEYVMKLFRPGAILWLAATAWIIGNNVVAGRKRKELQAQTFAIGRQIGLIT